MATVKVSRNYRIQFPPKIREEMKLKPGQELAIYVRDGKIHLSPHLSIQELRGIAKGIEWRDDLRDRNDRF